VEYKTFVVIIGIEYHGVTCNLCGHKRYWISQNGIYNLYGHKGHWVSRGDICSYIKTATQYNVVAIL
jgi:hypothetical protein